MEKNKTEVFELEFRLANKEDFERVLNVYADAINEMTRVGVDQWDNLYPDRNVLKNDIIKKQLYVGLFEATVASAYVINQECDAQYVHGACRYPNSTFYVVHRLCVSPTFQNKRIGTLTMKHIENEVQKKGIDTIRLDAFTLNPYAIKLYQNLGYCKVGLVRWRKGEFYLMEKMLIR